MLLLRLRLAVIFAAASLLSAGEPAGADPAITAGDVLNHVRYLAHDELEGRAAGTPGAEKAAHYIAAWFAKAGLKPLGDEGTYLQWFEFTAGNRPGDHNACQVQIGSEVQLLKPNDEFRPTGFSANGSAEGEVVFAGYGISAPDVGYDDYAGLDVKDKIVLVLRYSPLGENDRGPLGRRSSLRRKAATAGEQGARAILFFNPPDAEEEDRLDAAAGGMREGQIGLPAAFISREVASRLLRTAGIDDLGAWQMKVAHGGPQPDSRLLPGVRVQLTCEVITERRRTANVVGLLEGRASPDQPEYIVIGAHYDHLGVGRFGSLGGSGQIHNGADDNASGTAGVIELAEYLAAQSEGLERSLVLVAFAAEEVGLLGSNHFVNHPPVPLERIRAMVNLDMIGRSKDGSVQVLGSQTAEAWPELIAWANQDASLSPKLGSSPVGGSDHMPFEAHNIPVLFFFTGLHPQYHRPEDDWHLIEANSEARIVQMVARLVCRLAQSSQQLQFVKVERPRPDRQQERGFRVYLGTVPDYAAEVDGVRLAGVSEGGPAAKAGLQGGDVIVEVGGKAVHSLQDYTDQLREAEPQKPLSIVVLRDGNRLTLTVVPEARP